MDVLGRAANRRGHLVLGLCLAGMLVASLPAPLLAQDTEQAAREVPDFDGREDPPATAGEAALWVPRVLFFPVYLVTEYLLRLPLGLFVTWLEEERILERAGNVFTFGGSKSGFVPTVFWEFSFRPSVGIYFWTDDAWTNEDRFTVHGVWGGDNWWRLTVRQNFAFGPDPPESEDWHRIYFNFVLDNRPDHLFNGVGPDSDDDLDGRFFHDRIGGMVNVDLTLGVEDRMLSWISFFHHKTGASTPFHDSVPFDTLFDPNDPEQLPGGFGEYNLLDAGLWFLGDTRDPRPAPGHGLAGEIWGRLSIDPSDSDLVFARSGLIGELLLDVSGYRQTLALRQSLAFVHNIGDAAVPFNELLTNTGLRDISPLQGTLPGFAPGRFRGESLFETTLGYSYPLWMFLDGFVFTSVGNVFGEYLEDFAFEDMVLNFGLGFVTPGASLGFGMLIGGGTNQFSSDDFDLDEFRFLIGLFRGV